jgi:hypothetical protein
LIIVIFVSRSFIDRGNEGSTGADGVPAIGGAKIWGTIIRPSHPELCSRTADMHKVPPTQTRGFDLIEGLLVLRSVNKIWSARICRVVEA